jgi:hypothetical protein
MYDILKTIGSGSRQKSSGAKTLVYTKIALMQQRKENLFKTNT